MSSPPSASSRGFTLVEMLVALAVFALLAAAGVGILRASVDTQRAVETRLSQLSRAGRVHALLTADLAQAVDRATRGPNGSRAAFEGDASGMTFVRTGWTNLDGAPRSSLQRVSWRLTDAQLVRSAARAVDGDDQPAFTAAVSRPILSASFRYRLRDGSWSAGFRSTPPQPLPSAVEVSIGAPGATPLVMVFAPGVTGAAAPSAT